MRVDRAALALRLTLAWFLLTVVVLFLYLTGTAQSFLEPTQSTLFRAVRWLSWLGLLASWLLLFPLTRRRKKRLLWSGLLGLGFAVVFAFVLVWGAWIYPEAGKLPW